MLKVLINVLFKIEINIWRMGASGSSIKITPSSAKLQSQEFEDAQRAYYYY
jgi:hypothetical protein